jgi:iron(III) transport system permease protein
MAEALYCFPHALIILTTALSLADARLYEAAAVLGTLRRRVFWTVTLPGARYGLVSAAFVVFTLVITDFGIPKVIGGQFNVLATDAYKQVVGQQNFPMGAVVGLLMLVPAVLAFASDRLVRRKDRALLTARSVPYVARRRAGRDLGFALFCTAIGGLVLATYGVAVWASLIRYWPYDLSLTLTNYDFATTDPDRWQPYFNSLKMSALVAVIGASLVLGAAYCDREAAGVRARPRRSATPCHAAPRGAWPRTRARIRVLLQRRREPVERAVRHARASRDQHGRASLQRDAYHRDHNLKQIDGEFEAVSASLGVPFWTTFRRVTLPICLPTLLNMAVYLFTTAMTTVSAVIFLYGPDTKLASIAIVHMDEAGTTAAAAAMGTLILATAIAVKLMAALGERFLFGRLQDWRGR